MGKGFLTCSASSARVTSLPTSAYIGSAFEDASFTFCQTMRTLRHDGWPWVKGCLSYMADTVIDGNVLTWSSGHDWASEPDEPVAGAGVDFEESDAATFSSLAWSTSSKIRTKLFYETKCQQTSAAGRLLHDIVLIYTIWAFSLNMQIYQAPSSPLHRWFCLL